MRLLFQAQEEMRQKNKKTSLNVTVCLEATLHMLMIKQDSETNTNITYKAKQHNRICSWTSHTPAPSLISTTSGIASSQPTCSEMRFLSNLHKTDLPFQSVSM